MYHWEVWTGLQTLFQSLREVDFNSLLTSNRYQLENGTFSMSNRANRCYCSGARLNVTRIEDDRRLASCDGQHDLSTCSVLMPHTISFPHFLFADRLRKSVHGLMPKFHEHHSYFDIEQTFGLTVRARFSMQVNLKVGPHLFPRTAQNWKKEVSLPFLWFIEVSIRNFLVSGSNQVYCSV